MPPTGDTPVEVEIVVAVHRRDRPLSRALRSILSSESAGAVVVAHGILPSELDLPEDARVRVIEVPGGVGHPGVAFNAGIQAATAPWVGIMGSDDWFEDGAVESMLAHLRADRADGVIAPLRYDHRSENLVVPVTRRRRNLQAARDHLFHRTAPLGLFRREVLQDPHFRLDEETVSGEDLEAGVRLWTSGRRWSYYPADPAYVVGSDGGERTTTLVRPLPEHAAAWMKVWAGSTPKGLTERERQDLAEKMFQTHIIPLLQTRPKPEDWPRGDFEWTAELTQMMAEHAPGFNRGFTRSWETAYQGLLEGDRNAALSALPSGSFLDNRLPAHPREVLHRNSWWRKQARERLAKTKFRREDAHRRRLVPSVGNGELE